MASKDESLSFAQLNEEINEFYKYLKDNKYSDGEISELLEPIFASKEKKPSIKGFLLITVALSAFLYIFLNSETIEWHATAITRILLIKLLPFWNWESLKDQRCLVPKFGTAIETSPKETVFNCDVCETVEVIDAYGTLDALTLKSKYLDLDVPVILTNTPTGWPQDAKELISNISTNKNLRQSIPCNVGSNVVNGKPTVGKILDRTELFESFFVHFQNCEVPAVKNFRLLVPRPSFLHAELSPVQTSWFLWSNNYNVSKYKMVNLVDKIAVVGQISGTNYFSLVPRGNCENNCHILDVKLKKGEVLVLTSLWDLEYRPEEKGENVAVILETH